MKTKKINPFADIEIFCLFLAIGIGLITGCVVVVFKGTTSLVIELSETCYNYVWNNPMYLPVLLLSMVILGLIASKTTARLGNCSGGGIPTAIAGIRGLIDIRPMKNVFLVFGSALVTYLGGIPLGNEGPSVQMGTAVGKGLCERYRDDSPKLKRDLMAAGACAGFAAATCSPLAGILFAFEEARCKWSLQTLLVAAFSAQTAMITAEFLGEAIGISRRLFDFTVTYMLPFESIWSAVLIGLICGGCAILFTRTHGIIRVWIKMYLGEMKAGARICCLFAVTAVIGFIFPEVTGSGHHLVEYLIEGHGIWQMLILCLLLRAALLIVANNMGVTGGIFVPTLAMGAIIGTVSARILAEIGWISQEAIPVLIIVGVVAFLAAASHIPCIAIMLALEDFVGFQNLLPIVLGVGFAYAVVRIGKAEDFTEQVVERKAEAER